MMWKETEFENLYSALHTSVPENSHNRCEKSPIQFAFKKSDAYLSATRELTVGLSSLSHS
ncbi:hypothetical protein ES707_08853 [subsurface metagenome]